MTTDQQTYLLIRGTIADLPASDRQAVEAAVVEINAIVERAPAVGSMAVALVAAKMAAEA